MRFIPGAARIEEDFFAVRDDARREKVKVAIGGSYGLLGQDIYGEYGIAIGSHLINLHK